jgi:predicted RNA-binding protein YlqC (UPF0109 family)
MDLEQYVRDIIAPYVTNNEALMVRRMPGMNDNEIILLVIGESNDIARLIGRGGQAADSIREVVNVAGKLTNQRVRIKFESFAATEIDE